MRVTIRIECELDHEGKLVSAVGMWGMDEARVRAVPDRRGGATLLANDGRGRALLGDGLKVSAVEAGEMIDEIAVCGVASTVLKFARQSWLKVHEQD